MEDLKQPAAAPAQRKALKGFACQLRGFDGEEIVHALDASKARYTFLLRVQDPYPSAKFSDVRVRRSPTHDLAFPELPPVGRTLDAAERDVVLHAFGGGTHKRPTDWGNRDHFCTAPGDERLNRLVSLGLFRGPFGVSPSGDTPGWTGAFFYLTGNGKALARALIGERELAGTKT
jgi:hypothetical protein